MEESRTIAQLELHFAGAASEPSSETIQYAQLKQIPVKELSVEQLRLLLVKNIGVPFLLPRITDVLENDILADGDFYPGDLLSATLNVDRLYWQQNPSLATRLYVLLLNNRATIQDAGHKKLSRQIEEFLAAQFAAA